MKTRYILIISTLLYFLAPSLAAQEQRHPVLENDFYASVGAFIISKDVKLRVDGTSPGDEIDFDKRWSLGGSKTSAAAVFGWRFGEKWSVSGQYLGSDDSARATLTENVQWGDLTFELGSNVGAGIGLDVARVFVGRTIAEGQDYDFRLGLGLHWLEISAFLDGNAIVDGEEIGRFKEVASAGGPLPNIGASYRYAFTPKWLLNTRLDWFSANIDEYSGSLWNTSLGIEYQALDNFGVSLAYQLFHVDVDVDNSNWNGAVALNYRGPFLSLTASW